MGSLCICGTATLQQAAGRRDYHGIKQLAPDEAASDCELLLVTGLLPVPGKPVVPAVPTAVGSRA